MGINKNDLESAYKQGFVKGARGVKVMIDGKEYVNKEDYKRELLDYINEKRKDFEPTERVQVGFDISETIISNS